MEKKPPAPPAYREELIGNSFNAELEALAYISQAEDGIVLLEEIEDKHFSHKPFQKYFSVLKNLHITSIEKPDIEMQIVKDQINLITPLQTREALLKRMRDYWFALKFYDFMSLSLQYLQHKPYTKMHETAKEVIDTTFNLLENESKINVSVLGDLSYEELYEESSLDEFRYYALEGVLIRPACVYVIGGRPGHGKTSFGLNLMLRGKEKSAFFSYEMPIKKLQDILVRARFDIPSSKIKQERQKIVDGLHTLAEENRLYLIDSSSLTIDKLIAKIRFLHRKHKINIFYIDYLGLIPSGKRFEKRYLEIGSYMRDLKLLSIDLNICIITLAQLSREVDKSATNRLPSMSDLKESGSIEESADLIMLIHSYSSADPESNRPYELAVKIAKNRYGPLGIKKLHFNKSTGAIYDWQDEY